MEGPAPKEIESAEQPTEDLHEGVRKPLKEMGLDDPEVPPTQIRFPLTGNLEQLGVDASHVIGSKLEELTSGTGGSTLDRMADRKNPISLAWERAKKLKARLRKAA